MAVMVGRLKSIMLKNIPIILSGTSFFIHLLCSKLFLSLPIILKLFPNMCDKLVFLLGFLNK